VSPTARAETLVSLEVRAVFIGASGTQRTAADARSIARSDLANLPRGAVWSGGFSVRPGAGRSSDSRALRGRRLPTVHRFPALRTSARRGGRSRSPLRGSPGFAPDSLFAPDLAGAPTRRHLSHAGREASMIVHGLPVVPIPRDARRYSVWFLARPISSRLEGKGHPGAIHRSPNRAPKR
jgi:hypothetical protein